jgi:hypothetical protein
LKCRALVEPNPPTFFDLYSRGHALHGEIDDYIDRWHERDDARARALPLHEYLGLTGDEYELWVHDPDVLPLILIARRQSRPLMEVMNDHLDELPVAARADEASTVRALRAWLAKRQKR